MKDFSFTQKLLLILNAGFFFILGEFTYVYFPKDYTAPQYQVKPERVIVSQTETNGMICETYYIAPKGTSTSCYKK